jgi:PAS domain-containing protein
MNFWTVVHFLCCLVYVTGFFYVIIKNPYSVANWVLAMLFLFFAVWSFCNAVIYNTGVTLETATAAIKTQGIGWASFITYYFLFILFLTGNKKMLENPLTYIVLISVPGIFVYQNFSGNMLSCCRSLPYGMSADWKYTIWTFAYYAYYTVMFFAGTTLLFFFRNRTKIKTEKRIANILLLSAVVVFVFGTLINVVLKYMDIFLPLDANLFFLVFVVGLVYCAEKYEMLNLTGTRVADKIMASINEGHFLLGRDGEILSANKAAMEIFGYGESQRGIFEGKNIEKGITAIQEMIKNGAVDFELAFEGRRG